MNRILCKYRLRRPTACMSAGHVRLGLPTESGCFQPASLIFEQSSQIVEAEDHIRMVRAEAFLIDGERAPHQGLGIGKTVRGLKQRRQIVEAYGHIGMIGPEAFLVDGERAAH